MEALSIINWHTVAVFCSADSWHFNLKNKHHCIVPYGATEDDILSCSITFSVCKPLSSCDGLTTSSTYEEVTLHKGTTFQFNIGDYRGNNEFAPLGTLSLSLSFHACDGYNILPPSTAMIHCVPLTPLQVMSSLVLLQLGNPHNQWTVKTVIMKYTALQ